MGGGEGAAAGDCAGGVGQEAVAEGALAAALGSGGEAVLGLA